MAVIGGIVLTVVASPHATKEWELDELMGRYTVAHCPECVVSECANTILLTDSTAAHGSALVSDPLGGTLQHSEQQDAQQPPGGSE